MKLVSKFRFLGDLEPFKGGPSAEKWTNRPQVHLLSIDDTLTINQPRPLFKLFIPLLQYTGRLMQLVRGSQTQNWLSCGFTSSRTRVLQVLPYTTTAIFPTTSVAPLKWAWYTVLHTIVKKGEPLVCRCRMLVVLFRGLKVVPGRDFRPFSTWILPRCEYGESGISYFSIKKGVDLETSWTTLLSNTF